MKEVSLFIVCIKGTNYVKVVLFFFITEIDVLYFMFGGLILLYHLERKSMINIKKNIDK